MKREQLDKYLNKKIKIKLFDGDIFEGYLRKTSGKEFEKNSNLYTPKNYYFLCDDDLNCVSCLFRMSHIISIKCA